MKIGPILKPQDAMQIRASLQFQEVNYTPSKDISIKDGIELPTEDEALEMLNEESDFDLEL